MTGAAKEAKRRTRSEAFFHKIAFYGFQVKFVAWPGGWGMGAYAIDSIRMWITTNNLRFRARA